MTWSAFFEGGTIINNILILYRQKLKDERLSSFPRVKPGDLDPWEIAKQSA